jgi:hypothetical protein
LQRVELPMAAGSLRLSYWARRRSKLGQPFCGALKPKFPVPGPMLLAGRFPKRQ